MPLPTLRAQLVLNDCKLALERLEGSQDETERRLLWVLCCALLKSVAHVLHDHDAKSGDAALSDVINKWWDEASHNKHGYPILWEFIDKERHNILKRYEFSAN